MTRMILEGLDAKVVDINNAFLIGDLDHEIFMKIPEGYKECIQDYDEEKTLKLDKAIYGLVQAARQFWKKLTCKLKEAGFKPSIVDPCLFQCKGNRGLSILIMYIDDLLIIGKPETNESTIHDLKQYFDIKKPTTLDDYFGVQVIKSEDQKRAWSGQPTIIDPLTKKFGKEVEKQRITLTPGMPGFIGARQNEEGARINEDQQQEYRSGVGTLQNLTKHSRPDIANAVHELSKSMDGASKLQFREMLRVIKFVLDTKDLSLKMVPTLHDGIWHLEAFSDSDFANDKETRISVYWYVIYFCGVPVAWRSKSMRSVVLSTTEAEYVAISEVVNEIKFVYQ